MSLSIRTDSGLFGADLNSDANDWTGSFANNCVSLATQAAEHLLDYASPDEDQICFMLCGGITHDILYPSEPHQNFEFRACVGLQFG